MNTTAPVAIRPERPIPISLLSILRAFSCTTLEAPKKDLNELLVTGATLHAQAVIPGDLYFAVAGSSHHGAEFARDAADRGAVALCTDAEGARIATQLTSLPILVSPKPTREIMGHVSAMIYGTDTGHAQTLGVTGTNGKTSVIYALSALAELLELSIGISTTAERRVNHEVMPSGLTSPEAPELHALLARMRELRVDLIGLEVSAHAVARHRIDGVTFDVVAFNNFSHDHLDDFDSLESYFAAKLALFRPEHAKRAVVVVDSQAGQRVAREAQIPVTRLATEYGQDADWHLAVTRESLDGVSFVLQGPQGAHLRGSIPLFGRFMAENVALAAIMLIEAGIAPERLAHVMRHREVPLAIPGRLEEMTLRAEAPEESDPPRIRFFVDYGHTPGSFQAMLEALGHVAPGRVLFLFGADGDRDTSKRHEMGRIAGREADVVIVCDYHPRSEPPERIRAQLIAGANEAGRAIVYEEADPRRAIRLAISLATPGDVILYAGPGHEDYQEVAGKKIPYSARNEVAMALREAGVMQ